MIKRHRYLSKCDHISHDRHWDWKHTLRFMTDVFTVTIKHWLQPSTDSSPPKHSSGGERLTKTCCNFVSCQRRLDTRICGQRLVKTREDPKHDDLVRAHHCRSSMTWRRQRWLTQQHQLWGKASENHVTWRTAPHVSAGSQGSEWGFSYHCVSADVCVCVCWHNWDRSQCDTDYQHKQVSPYLSSPDSDLAALSPHCLHLLSLNASTDKHTHTLSHTPPVLP